MLGLHAREGMPHGGRTPIVPAVNAAPPRASCGLRRHRDPAAAGRLQGSSRSSAGWPIGRGPMVPRRAFSDWGWPVMMAAYMVALLSTFFT